MKLWDSREVLSSCFNFHNKVENQGYHRAKWNINDIQDQRVRIYEKLLPLVSP